MEGEGTCTYERADMYPPYVCPYPAAPSGLCIFHLHKPSAEQKKLMSPAELDEASALDAQFFSALPAVMAPHLEKYNFVGFVFPRTDWRGPSFNKIADFSHAKFPEGIEFGNVTFEDDAYFNEAEFHSGFFSSTIFKRRAGFTRARFTENTNFNNVKFEQGAFFDEAAFLGDWLSFHTTTFEGEARFTKATFGEESKRGVVLEHPADFSAVTFEKGCRFDGAVFNRAVTFRGSTLSEEANFISTDFHQEANFMQARLAGEVKFWWTNFHQDVTFNSAEISGFMDFVGGRVRCFNSVADMERLKLTKDASVSFDRVNLSKASFLYTNLEAFQLLAVEWFRPQGKLNSRFRLRPRLWGEQLLGQPGRDESFYERTADSYRQLVINYEKKRDYDTAEDFHIGEMEIRRKKMGIYSHSPKWRHLRQWLNAVALYRLLSNYGTSYVKALCVLAVLFVAFSTSFHLSGFQPRKENVGYDGGGVTPQAGVIEYDLIPGDTQRLASAGQVLADFGKASLFCLSILTLQRERHYEPASWQSQLFSYLAVLTLTTQAAMVLLAVRRRFKR